MDLTHYDFIVLNTSAGKDSQAMMDYVSALATLQNVHRRLVAAHADLGRVEWRGTRELAQRQCDAYRIPLTVVHREKGDLLEQVEQRGMWPDAKNRYCTSDQKRDQIAKYHTGLADELFPWLKRPVRILNCMGFRAQESPARAKKPVLAIDQRISNGRKEVTNWLPIHPWTEEDVWQTIRASGVPHHFAYDLGMPRLSCVFCIFAPTEALVIAGRHNPELLDEYIRIEEKIGHTFKNGFRIAEVKETIRAHP